MTIHHDKMAYGKLASLREDLTQEQLNKMSEQLEGESEYDRMVRGELYNPAEEQLAAMRKRARRLFYRYNNSEEDEQELRRTLLHELFGSHGEHMYCEPPLRFDYGCNFHVGENFFSNFNLTVLDVSPVRVGKDCIIGAGALLTQGTRIPDGMLALGSPAKVIRPLTEQEKESIRNNGEEYIRLGKSALKEARGNEPEKREAGEE